MNLKNKTICLLMVFNMLHDMPFLGFRYPSVLYALLVIVLFLLLWTHVRFNTIKSILVVFTIPLLNIFTLDTSSYIQLFQYISGLLQLTLYPLMALFIFETRNYKLAYFLFVLYAVMNLITCITTYYGNITFPGASRILATGDLDGIPFQNAYQLANIGGFSFIYNMVMFVPILICTWKYRNLFNHSRLINLLSIAFVVIIFFTLLAAEYTTSLLLFVLCLFLFLIGNKINFKKMLLWGCIGWMVLVFLKDPVANLFIDISESVESVDISERLMDIAYNLRDESVSYDSDLNSRQEKYGKSINSFIENPFGNWSQEAVGGHSFFLDSLGKFGILGLFFLVLLYYRIFKIYIYPIRNNGYYGYALFVFLIFIVTSVVNPQVFFDFMMFVLPLYYYILGRRDGQPYYPHV